MIGHHPHPLHRGNIPNQHPNLSRRARSKCRAFRDYKAAQIRHNQFFLDTLVICITQHHDDRILSAAFQIFIRKCRYKLHIQNFYRGTADHRQCKRLIFHNRSGGDREMPQKLTGTTGRIPRVTIYTSHIHLCLHIAAGSHQYAGNFFYIALVKGQLQHVTGLDCLILLIRNIDIPGCKDLTAAAHRGILQRNGNISVFRNQVCRLSFIAQHQIYLLRIGFNALDITWECIEFHFGISVLTIQIEGIDHNTGPNLLHDHMVHICVYQTCRLCLHKDPIQGTHSGSRQSADRINGFPIRIRQTVNSSGAGFQYGSIGVGILRTNINIKCTDCIICHVYKDIHDIILRIRQAGYRADPCILLGIQLNRFMLAEVNFLINIAVCGQEEFKGRDLIHRILAQVLRCTQVHIFILIIDLQKPGFHHQCCRNIRNLQGTAVQALHIQRELSQLCNIRNADNKAICMIFPEHKAIVRNRQGGSGASGGSVIQINRRFISIVIHGANDIKGKLLPFALLIVILQGGFHGAIERTAAAAFGICTGAHAEFQIQSIGAVGNRIGS